MSPLPIHSTARASNSGSGPCSPNCRGPPSSSDRCPVPMTATRSWLGQASMISRSVWPSLTNRSGRGSGGREDVGVDRHDRQVVLRPHGEDRARDRVVDPQLVGEGEVEARVQPGPQDVRGQLLVALEQQLGQPELPLFVVVVGVVERRLAHQELRHVVQPQLVEVVRADHDQDVRAGPGQRLAVRLDLAHPLGRERRRLVRRQLARARSRTGGAWWPGSRPVPPWTISLAGCLLAVRPYRRQRTVVRSAAASCATIAKRDNPLPGGAHGRTRHRARLRRGPRARPGRAGLLRRPAPADEPDRDRRRHRAGPPDRPAAAAHPGRAGLRAAGRGPASPSPRRCCAWAWPTSGRSACGTMARPHLEALVAQTGESSSMAQLDGSDIVYVARVSVPKIITLRVVIGTRFPALQTSQGKVLLAALDPRRAGRHAWPSRAAPACRPSRRRTPTPSRTNCARSGPAAGPWPTRNSRPASARWPCRSATATARCARP